MISCNVDTFFYHTRNLQFYFLDFNLFYQCNAVHILGIVCHIQPHTLLPCVLCVPVELGGILVRERTRV